MDFARSGRTSRSPSAHDSPPGLPYAATDTGNAAIAPGPFSEPAISLFRLRASDAEIGKPRRASSAAGMTTSFHGSVPKRLCASARPLTVPGTPGARYPARVRLLSTFPSWPRYIVCVDFDGAFSR